MTRLLKLSPIKISVKILKSDVLGRCMKMNKITKIGILSTFFVGLGMSYGENFCPNCGYKLREPVRRECNDMRGKKCRAYWLRMRQEGRLFPPKFCKGNEMYRNCHGDHCNFKQDKRRWEDPRKCLPEA